MKKALFFVLQIVSLFLFVALLSGVYGIFKEVVNSQEGLAYNFGYCFGAALVFGLLFWLNLKLYKYASSVLDTSEKHKSDDLKQN